MTARISIDGNLVADPDFGVGDSGTSWAHLRVASHERLRRNGEWVNTDPEFYNVTMFGAAAETVANELHKGDRITVEGRPQLETFSRRDGSTGAAVKVYARSAVKAVDQTPTSADMSRDVVVRIDNANDPSGPPAYQGPVSGAHTRLTPGIYSVAAYGDGQAEFATDVANPVQIRVTGSASYIDNGSAGRAEPDSPRIHHTADATAVVGVSRTAAALHKTLKDNGFRWSTSSTSWNLPKDMDEHTRSARVSELLSAVRANGRDLPVVNDAAPAGRTPLGSQVNAGAAPDANVTVLRPAGRTL